MNNLTFDCENLASEINIYNKYARYLPELKRRETWNEICDRVKNMHIEKFPQLREDIQSAFHLVKEKKILPSMRSLQFAGKSIKRNHARIYNCSFMIADNYKIFQEATFLLLSGTGFGYSVQKQHVEKLPAIKHATIAKKYLIGDSIEGWSEAVAKLVRSHLGLSSTYPIFDYSDIRPEGTPLKTSGGYAPGHRHLEECLDRITGMFRLLQDGEKMSPLFVHDVLCHIADCVVTAGTRRAACISFFSLDDDDMLKCKTGSWWETNLQRCRSNNSVVLLKSELTHEKLMHVWKIIEESNAGEPGIYLTNDYDVLSNPCLSKNDTVLTPDGYKTIEKLMDTPHEFIDVIASDNSIVKATRPFKTGEKELFEITLSNGQKHWRTANHKQIISTSEGKIKKEIKDITTEDDIILSNNNVLTKVNLVKIESIGIHEVYDLTVDHESHTFYDKGWETCNCGEISLENHGFCNLVEINGSNVTSQEDLNERCKWASFIATLQSSFTDFHFISNEWVEQAKKDAQIGIGITGICDGTVMHYNLKESAKIILDENKTVSKQIGINPSVRCTTIKPSGNSSVVLKTSSGVHARYAPFYWRRMKMNKQEPLMIYLKSAYPFLIEEDILDPSSDIVRICIKSPEGSVFRTESPIQFLDRVKTLHKNWIKPGHREGVNTNNVSATCYVKENEWDTVGKWLWENREHYYGLSFLPYDSGTYTQPPFEECTEEEYEKFVTNCIEHGMHTFNKLDLTRVYEDRDITNLSGEAACSGGACEIV